MAKTKVVKPKSKGKATKTAKKVKGAARKTAAKAKRILHREGAANGHTGEPELLVTLASEEELQEEPVVLEQPEEEPAPRLEQPLTTEWSLPEQYLMVAINDDWDDRMEKVKAGRHGAGLAASLLLELVVHGRLRIHLDRYQVIGEPTGDPALDNFAHQVEALGERKAQDALELLGRKVTQHLRPWRGRLHRRGVAREETWRFLGVFPRSRMLVTDPDAKAKLENRLQRTLVGGTPDVRTILLLGLIDAGGLLPEIIPEGALAFNRRRINALLTGRDTLGYRVDPGMANLQGPLVHGLLRDVRTLSGNRS